MDDSQKADFFKSVLIVLVIYETKISESPTYQSLTASLRDGYEAASLFIYDNSSQSQEPLTDQCWDVYYTHNPSNPGVSKAYNEGCKKAKELSKKWLLLTDQDTIFPLNSLDGYFKCAKGGMHQVIAPILKDQNGIVSPFKFYLGGGFRVKNLSALGLLKFNDYSVINSGLLISIYAFEQAGGYDESLPLDFSDVSFIRRLRNENQFFVLTDFRCEHGLSAGSYKDFDERLNRFKLYLEASQYFKRVYDSGGSLIIIRAYLRAIKLGLKYKSFKFIALAINLK